MMALIVLLEILSTTPEAVCRIFISIVTDELPYVSLSFVPKILSDRVSISMGVTFIKEEPRTHFAEPFVFYTLFRCKVIIDAVNGFTGKKTIKKKNFC